MEPVVPLNRNFLPLTVNCFLRFLKFLLMGLNSANNIGSPKPYCILPRYESQISLIKTSSLASSISIACKLHHQYSLLNYRLHGSTLMDPHTALGHSGLWFSSCNGSNLTVNWHTEVGIFLELALIYLKTEATYVFLQVSIEDTYNTDSMYLSPSE